MTGAELIDKIHQYSLEDCEIDTHPYIVFKLSKTWKNGSTTRGYLWVENDYFDDVKYNSEGSLTYGP